MDAAPCRPLLWVRYIDDVLLVWPHSLPEFEVLLGALNGARPRIWFTAETAEESIDFLDLTIYKPVDFALTGKLATKIYYKPTNTFSYPRGDSYMPRNILKSIVVGEAMCILRNTSSPILYKRYRNKLIANLRFRRYPASVLRAIWALKHRHRQRYLDRRSVG